MAQDNKGFLSGLGERDAAAAPNRLPPRTSILSHRENRLAELAGGASQTRFHELVAPERCRIWRYHNRDYASLSPESCADLIDSIKAQGRQEVPAIVRRLPGGADHAWEVICGARRHWTIAWLRRHDYPDLKFLIEPRELNDEEAFRIADLENRSRKDLSDFERAADYARAVSLFYDGNQQRMADRLQVSKSWLSRYLELARLPQEVLAAFGTPHAIGISHAAALAPLLRVPASANAILTAAAILAEEQRVRFAAKEAYLPPQTCIRRLTEALAQRPSSRRRASIITIPGKDGTPLLQARAASRGEGLTIDIPRVSGAERTALIAAFAEVMDSILSDAAGAGGRRSRRGRR